MSQSHRRLRAIVPTVEPTDLKPWMNTASLRAGESKQVTVTLDARAFSIWSMDSKSWTPIPGTYGVFVGDSSQDLPLQGTITFGK